VRGRISWRLVIDASVARAAGRADNPVSRLSRQFLENVLKICHRLVLTSEIAGEWKRHRSRFTYHWYAAMVARRKVVRRLQRRDPEFQSRLGETALADKAREAARKDLPLVEAALSSDRVVVSLDDEARNLFSQLSSVATELRGLMWVNPVRESESLTDWLRRGRRPVRHWQLGCWREGT